MKALKEMIAGSVMVSVALVLLCWIAQLFQEGELTVSLSADGLLFLAVFGGLLLFSLCVWILGLWK